MLFFKTADKTRLVMLSSFVLLLQSCASVDVAQDDDQQLKQLGQDIVAMADENDTIIHESTKPLPPQTPEQLAVALNKAGSLSEQYALQQQYIDNNTPENAKAIYRKGVEQLKQKNYSQALGLFEQVLVLAPNLSGAMVNKAIIAKANGDIELAKAQLQKALLVNELNPFALNMLGLIARDKGEFVYAERHYSKAIAIMPDYADPHLNYAILLELYRGRYREAHQQYQTYSALKPDDQLVKRWIAGLEIKMRDQIQLQPLESQVQPKAESERKADDEN